MLGLAGDDPTKLDALRRMSLIDYYILLDKRLKEIQKLKK